MQRTKTQQFLLPSCGLFFASQALAHDTEAQRGTAKNALPLSGTCRRVTTAQVPKPPRYLTHVKHVENRDGTTKRDEVTIEDTRTHKTLWKHTFHFLLSSLEPSSNPAAFLFCEAHFLRNTNGGTEWPDRETLWLYVWRAGKGVRLFSLDRILPRHTDFSMDYFMPVDRGYYALWSPDGQRILLRTGASGASMIDAGPLYCLDIRAAQMRHVAGGVRNATWSGNRRIRYRQLEGEPFVLDPKLYTWTWR